MDVIDTFLGVFIAYIDSGFGLLAGDVAYLTTTLIAIDITLAGLFWALSHNTDVIAGLLKKVLYVGAFAFIIGNFSFLANIVFDSFAGLGLKAAGGTHSAQDLMRPGHIAGTGLDAATPLLVSAGELLGPIAFFENFILIAILLIAWAIIIAAFFILAVQLFITILEFKLTTLAGFVLVPFALWNKTAFLAERVLGHVVTSGIRLMVLAVITGIGSTLFASVTSGIAQGQEITLSGVMSAVLAATVFLWMGLFSPALAAGLITGAPQLGAGSAAGAAAGVAAGTYVAGMGGRAAVGAVAGGASSAVKAGASMAGAARTSYTLGSVASGASGAAGVAAGLGGVARAGGDAVRRAASRPAQSMREAYQRGSQGAWRATGGSETASMQSSASGSSSAQSPGWSQRLQNSQSFGQRMGQAGQMAAHSLRDGDRGASGANPTLRDKDD
jgi:type IV secretion system protein TrbL